MSRRLLAGTVLFGAGILTVVFRMNQPSVSYSRSVSDFLTHPVRERSVRVQGVVVPGSLCRESQGCGYRFRLTDGWSPLAHGTSVNSRLQLSVHYPGCTVPDSFRLVPGQALDLTLEGELCTNCHRFEAAQIFAKCPSVYWMGPVKCRQQGVRIPSCTVNWGDG